MYREQPQDSKPRCHHRKLNHHHTKYKIDPILCGLYAFTRLIYRALKHTGGDGFTRVGSVSYRYYFRSNSLAHFLCPCIHGSPVAFFFTASKIPAVQGRNAFGGALVAAFALSAMQTMSLPTIPTFGDIDLDLSKYNE